ncbi:RNA polymerase sigma factor [Bacteroidota bacterium]
MKNRNKYSSDQKLIEQIINKEELAILKVMPALKKNLKYFLFNQGKLNNNDLEDLINETFVAVFSCKIPELECKCSTYLLQIAKNIWFNKVRKKKETLLAMSDISALSSVEVVFEESQEDYALLNSAITSLSSRSQEILRLYADDYDAEHACKILGISSKKTYQVRKSECLKELKQHYLKLIKLEEQRYEFA